MRYMFWYWEAAISPERCDEIIEQCKAVQSTKGVCLDQNKSMTENSHRNSTIRWVQGIEGITSTLWPYAWEANRMAYNFDINGIFDVQFTEYDAKEEQYYKWHHDVEWDADRGYDRKMSIIIQLSDPDDYEGGDFEFKHTNVPNEFKKRGSVMTFPSYITHQVTPVTKGTRHSLVAWVEGPRWR